MKPSSSTPNSGTPEMPVPCRFWAEKLAAGHPDDLSPVESMALQAHLAHCPSCSAVRAEYEAIWQELRQLPAIEPRAGLPPALLKLWQAQPQATTSENNGERAAQTMPSLPVRRRRRSRPLIQTLAAVLVIAAVLGTFLTIFAVNHNKLTITGANSGGWHIVKSPNPGKTENILDAVAIAASNDIWAVGYFSNSPTNDNGLPISNSALIEHWNGSNWSVVPAQSPGKFQNDLGAVAALSANDAWAVGDFINSSDAKSPDSIGHALIEHWNGRQWSIVPGATRPDEDAYLTDITAISANNIFAVGSYKSQALIEHWNGTQWSIVSTPNVAATGGGVGLDALTVISANDMWALGSSYTSTTSQPLIEHWNGSRWSIVPSPYSGRSYLGAAAAVTGNDIWAVGGRFTGSNTNNMQQTFIEHWNGSQWNIVPSPNISSFYDDYLSGVVAISANDVWAIGNSPRQYPFLGPALLLHWDGKSWHIVKGANLHQTNNNYLYGIARDPQSGTLWAVGTNGSGFYNDSTLIEAYP